MMRKLKAFLVLAGIFLLSGCPKVEAQTAVTLGPVPKAQFLDNTGAPLSGGKVFTYQAGTNTPLSTYTDSTGLIMNADPVILDAGGRANIWFQGQAYKIAVQNSGGTTIYTVDNFLVSPFLNGNNSWTGNETHSGIETFNGNVVFTAGGSMSGNFSGSPTFSGNPTFIGSTNFNTAIFNGTASFPGGLTADVISGLSQFPTSLAITGKAGTNTGLGQSIVITPGVGGAGEGGGTGQYLGGPGGAGANGGIAELLGGNGGTGSTGGGAVTVQAGNGQGAGPGGDIIITSGTGGTSSNQGRTLFTGGDWSISSLSVPTCTVTGAGSTATCTTLSPNSSDTSGVIQFTPSGTSIGSEALVTMTFTRTLGANVPTPCIFTLNGFSTGWDARGTAIQGLLDSNTQVAVSLDNNSTMFNTSPYWVNYFCIGN